MTAWSFIKKDFLAPVLTGWLSELRHPVFHFLIIFILCCWMDEDSNNLDGWKAGQPDRQTDGTDRQMDIQPNRQMTDGHTDG